MSGFGHGALSLNTQKKVSLCVYVVFDVHKHLKI